MGLGRHWERKIYYKNIEIRYYTFIIDIYSTKSLSEMVNKMGRTINSQLPSHTDTTDSTDNSAPSPRCLPAPLPSTFNSQL